MEFGKMVRDSDVQNGLLDSEAEGEGGMIWENGIETCILSSNNNFQRKKMMLYLKEHLYLYSDYMHSYDNT